jgi:hypothetical protein
MMRLFRPQMFKRGYTLAQRLGFRSSAVYVASLVLVPLVVGMVLLTARLSGFSVPDVGQ